MLIDSVGPSRWDCVHVHVVGCSAHHRVPERTMLWIDPENETEVDRFIWELISDIDT